ncbi:MAG TPA: hypothetical protein VFP68_19640 [Burkholderiaceae bacterium]|nr:hypothetical protein [Burkholderiaceae bacterium]
MASEKVGVQVDQLPVSSGERRSHLVDAPMVGAGNAGSHREEITWIVSESGIVDVAEQHRPDRQ